MDIIELRSTDILIIIEPEFGATEIMGNALIAIGAVRSVNGQIGSVELTSNDVGADPVGTAQNLIGTPTDFVSLINATMEI